MKKATTSATVTKTLLFDDRPLILLPMLATAIGVNEALVLRQVYFLLQMQAGGRIIDGEKWIWNSYEEWRSEHFPFFSIRTIRRAIESLEKSGLLRSCQPDGRKSRRKYYRIDYAALAADPRCGQNGQFNMARMDSAHPAKMDSSYTETTPESSSETSSTKESKETSFASQNDAEFSFAPEIAAEWKPSNQRTLSKADQLKRIKVPKIYPSEDEFNEYLEDNDHDNILVSRDLYLDLSRQKWHHWQGDFHKWTKIRDWKKYVDALNDKMEEAKCR